MLKKIFKLLNQKGQALVLYALLVPVMFTVGGAAVDFGWIYYNQSRLQNAADAAVLAGAEEFLTRDSLLSDFNSATLVTKSETNEISPRNDSSKKEYGDREAQHYIEENLSESVKVSKVDKNLFGEENADTIYYKITLAAQTEHLFDILNDFGSASLKAESVAKITRFNKTDDPVSGKNFIEQMEELKEKKVYAYWEVIQNEYKTEANALKKAIEEEVANGANREEVLQKYIAQLAEKYIDRGVSKTDAEKRAKDDLTGDRSANKARERSVTTSGNWWLKNATIYRTENLSLNGQGGNTWNEKQFDFDDIFINFLQDFSFKFSEDWDIGYKMPSGMNFKNCSIFDGATNPDNLRFNYRIFGLIGIEEDKIKKNGIFPYKVREGKESPDPLFARIESEPIKWEPFYSKSHTDWSSVHQIIINVNVSNFDEENDRPIIFFYDGPKKFDDNSPVRDSKPVILNLNANFRGVIYAPNSPVIVIGNGHKFKGFIIAKEFLKLKTDKDYKDYKKVIRQYTNSDGYELNNKYKFYNEIYIKAEDIKVSESENIPENAIAVKYPEGDPNLHYYIEKDADFYEKITQMRADSKYPIPQVGEFFINNKSHNTQTVAVGDVQTSGNIEPVSKSNYKANNKSEGDKIYSASDFNLASSEYDNFKLVQFINYTYLNNANHGDNFFTYSRAEQID